ncbi:DUF6491 family protein [Pseudomarimonas salicorniae]|uniref:DUF6491 family protein n=1 Tax=Pseudomarimonas salicorniae TaxID=2933270 RepID=A0ABT0GHR0_9GAMM|nr:DUF6491 family protein [Lysobacter sp. CAU 1642]MCK7594070.1 DUF6491 family protein [Lysobacter sp. CAU 1642]
MNVRVLLLVLSCTLLWACSSTPPLQRMEARLAEIESVAGEPVESFHFWRLDRWEPLGRKHVAVWTQIDKAWLIEVREPCFGLDYATSIGLSSTGQRVFQNFDVVHVDTQRCRIAEIRPVDVRALRALRKEPDASPAA